MQAPKALSAAIETETQLSGCFPHGHRIKNSVMHSFLGRCHKSIRKGGNKLLAADGTQKVQKARTKGVFPTPGTGAEPENRDMSSYSPRVVLTLQGLEVETSR